VSNALSLAVGGSEGLSRSRARLGNDALAASPRRRLTVRCNCLFSRWHNVAFVTLTANDAIQGPTNTLGDAQ
jgi:hypothetical protein